MSKRIRSRGYGIDRVVDLAPDHWQQAFELARMGEGLVVFAALGSRHGNRVRAQSLEPEDADLAVPCARVHPAIDDAGGDAHDEVRLHRIVPAMQLWRVGEIVEGERI